MINHFDKYQIIYYLSIVYFAILYYAIVYRNNNISLINVVFSHAYAHEDPPSPKNLDPLFSEANVVNFPQTKLSKKKPPFPVAKCFQ